MKSICIDGGNRVIAYCPDDLTGTDGWVYGDFAVEEPLTEGHDVPIYKLVDGAAVPRTAEEIAADVAQIIKPTAPPAPTLEGRVGDLEGDTETLAEAVNILLGVGSND
jgi:hypothetical protein